MKRLLKFCFMVVLIFLLGGCVDLPKDKVNDELDNKNKQPTERYESSITGEEVLFSLDNGLNWISSSEKMTAFDVWDIMVNEEIPSVVFFYATSYDQFFEEVEKNRAKEFYSYNFFTQQWWTNLLATYNEDYFEDNNLLFYYKFEPNISENYVHSVTINDSTLTLNVNRFEGMATALSSWFDFVTLKKSDVSSATGFNVVVRTITELRSSVELSANEAYIRDIYVHGLSVSDFAGLDNLKSVHVWTWGIMVDIKFNETITTQRLERIIDILDASEDIRSVGYTSDTWIRVTISNKFFDKYNAGTLTLEDIIGNKIEDSGSFTMEVLRFTPIVIIRLEMETHGREYYEAMIQQLKELNFAFVDTDIIW